MVAGRTERHRSVNLALRQFGVRSLAKQFTIIDGYNYLHVNGFIDSRSVGPGSLEKARNQLFGFLRQKMDAPARSRTTVVFDSREPDLPNRSTVHEVLVEFANQYEDADELITLLISRHSAPKQLTVVSSDHQIQQAATARGATAIDSDQWLDAMDSFRADNSQTNKNSTTPNTLDKPASEDPKDNAFWKNTFAMDEETLDLELRATDKPRRTEMRAIKPQPNQKTNDSDEEVSPDIFPPGYAEDLWEGDD